MNQPPSPEPSAAHPLAAGDTPSSASDQTFAVGDRVQLTGRPRYLKTADSMPMLRPPDLVDPAEVGLVVALKAQRQLAVRFRRGTFLVDGQQVVAASP